MDNSSLLKIAITAAIKAGQEILKIYETDFSVEIKSDNTPVTLADKSASNSIIKTLTPTNIPIISEEETVLDYEIRKTWRRVWLVDPLDGTKEFVKRNGEFTVNIALVENKLPIIGVIYSPVNKDLYFGSAGLGSFKISLQDIELDIENIIKLSAKLPIQNLPKTYTIVASRSHLSRELNQQIDKLKNLYGKVNIINVGSSIKQCWVAEGKAHEYLRLGTTMEWDTAAGQCILEQARSQLIDLETNLPMRYNKEDMRNNFFVAKHN